MQNKLHRMLLALLMLGFLFAQSVPLALAQEDEGTGSPVTVHVVQRGENLFRIALNYGLTTEEVARVNGISNPASIQVGQRLIIPVEPQVEPEPAVQTHIVQAGESLGSIATFYNISADELAQLNGIANPNALYVGQELMLTPDAKVLEEVPVSDEVEVKHIIQAGDTLFRLSLQYGITLDELLAANEISNAELVFVGQEIVIPGVQPPQLALDLPDVVTDFDITPQILVEGQTGRVRLTTTEPAEIAGVFLGNDLQVISYNEDSSHIIFVPIPIFTEPNIHPMELSLSANSGISTNIIVNIQIITGAYSSQTITLPDDKVPLLNPGVEENENQILSNLMSRFNPERYFEGPMGLPAAAVMNSPFGTRRSYNGSPFDRYHNGADFAGGPGTPVLAAAPGRVVMVDTLHIRGRSVIIDHGWGIYTNYAHMNETLVGVGDFVTTGQTIGTVGNTGRATGAHLHWELWVNGVPVDPMQWVRQSFP